MNNKECVIVELFFVQMKCVFVQVRRFSEAYFFTEHHKESSLTFQEELWVLYH